MSPDRVFRQRARARRRRTTVRDFVEISSDSEPEGPCVSSRRHHSPEVIDLTNLPSSPSSRSPSTSPLPDPSHPKIHNPTLEAIDDDDDDFATGHRQQSAREDNLFPASSARVKLPLFHPVQYSCLTFTFHKRPPWLRAALARLYSDHRDINIEVCLCSEKGTNTDMPSSWLIKCQECGHDKVCKFLFWGVSTICSPESAPDPQFALLVQEALVPAGPGKTLESLVQHIAAAHSHLRSVPSRE